MDQRCLIDKIAYNGPSGNPSISVIVVSYKSGKNIFDCLDALVTQSFSDFEVILVDNGGNEEELDRIRKYPITLVQMKQNTGCSAGKNTGASIARGQIICFIDDDGIAAPDFVCAHYLAHNDKKIVGVRGKVLPKDPTHLYNGLAAHYDLGDRKIPAFLDAETNISFRKEIFIKCGGFSSSVIRGDGEGINLSYRIVKELGERGALVYDPNAVVYHDFAQQFGKFLNKAITQPKAHADLIRRYPDIDDFIRSYSLPYGISHAPRDLLSRVKIFILRRIYRWLSWIFRHWYLWNREPLTEAPIRAGD